MTKNNAGSCLEQLNRRHSEIEQLKIQLVQNQQSKPVIRNEKNSVPRAHLSLGAAILLMIIGILIGMVTLMAYRYVSSEKTSPTALQSTQPVNDLPVNAPPESNSGIQIMPNRKNKR